MAPEDTELTPTTEPVEPTTPAAEPEAFREPSGEEPWYGFVSENIPEVLREKTVEAFREQERAANARIESYSRYEPVINTGLDPQELLTAHQFAQMLFSPIDPNDAATTQAVRDQRLRFHQQYTEQLESLGFLTPAEKQQADAEAARQAAEEEQFLTPEQQEIRALKAQLDAIQGQTQQVTQFTQQQYEQQQYQQLASTYRSEWEGVVAQHGQLSPKEFQLVSLLAQQDPDPSPGVIQRAFATMVNQFGRLPDVAAAPTTPRPPVLAPGGGAQVPVPEDTRELGFRSPDGRKNRRQLALEAIGLIGQEFTDTAN